VYTVVPVDCKILRKLCRVLLTGYGEGGEPPVENALAELYAAADVVCKVMPHVIARGFKLYVPPSYIKKVVIIRLTFAPSAYINVKFGPSRSKSVFIRLTVEVGEPM
jgi:hypothetical protein